MFDWLRFFPIALRYGHNTKRVRGPYCSKLRKKTFNINDTLINISIPRANSLYGFEPYCWKVDGVTHELFNALNGEDWKSNVLGKTLRGWRHNTLCFREFLFSGEWFTGRVASIKFSIDVVGQFDFSDFEGASFFHPNVFESALSNYLDSYFGHKAQGGSAYYRGPLNLHVLLLSSKLHGVCLDVYDVGGFSKEAPGLIRMVFIPLSNNRFINIRFDFGGARVLSASSCSKPMLELCNSIIRSISVDPSDLAIQSWNEIEKTCKNMSLTENFGELNWPIKPEDIGKVADLNESSVKSSTELLGKG